MELRRGSVKFHGLLAQSVASIGPSTVVAVIVAQIAGISGPGAWLTWMISTIVMTAVTLSITQLARRFVTTGGLYVLNAQAGSGFGVITAWAGLLYGIGSAPILPLAFGIFLTDFLDGLGFTTGPGTLLVAIFGCTLLAALLSWRDVGISATAMLAIEAVSLISIAALMIIVAVNHADRLFDSSQLELSGTSPQGIAGGVVLSLLAFAGFESSCYFGGEAQHPRSEISRSMLVSVVACGAFFVFCTYVMAIGLGSGANGLSRSANPLRDLAVSNGVGFLIDIVQPGVIISLFGVVISSLNGMSRLLMTLSHEGMLPSLLARIDLRTRTPAAAILLVAFIDIVAGTILIATGKATMDTYGNVGTVAGYWVGVTYMLACVAMIVVLWQTDALRFRHLLVGGIGVACFADFYYTSAVPLPPPPQDLFLYISVGGMMLALGHLIFLSATRSPVLLRLGASVLGVSEADTIQ